jgi:hypothetical protein
MYIKHRFEVLQLIYMILKKISLIFLWFCRYSDVSKLIFCKPLVATNMINRWRQSWPVIIYAKKKRDWDLSSRELLPSVTYVASFNWHFATNILKNIYGFVWVQANRPHLSKASGHSSQGSVGTFRFCAQFGTAVRRTKKIHQFWCKFIGFVEMRSASGMICMPRGARRSFQQLKLICFLALRKWGETFTNCGFLSVSIQFLPHHLHNNLQQ